MTYERGVKVIEVPTSLIPPVRTGTIVFAVGTAPQGPVNNPQLITTFEQFVETFGWDEDFEKYTLCEAAHIAFRKRGVAPFIAVNVFNPEVHKDANGNPDPTAVTADDIIGTVDPNTLKKTGLQTVDDVYPRFGIVPTILIAPKFSQDPAVASALFSKASTINRHFKALAIFFADADSVKPTDINDYLTSNNLRNPFGKFVYAKGYDGDLIIHPDTDAAFLYARLDVETDNYPFHTISNKNTSYTHVETLIDLDMANYLAGQGATTVVRTSKGLVYWGTRTTAYPGSTDPKDTFDNIRRAFNFHNNELILTFLQKVDYPITKRLIKTIVDSYNIRLNGLKAREYILGGRVEFREEENPVTDLMDGIIKFHVYITPPSPARLIEFIAEYDPSYWRELFK